MFLSWAQARALVDRYEGTSLRDQRAQALLALMLRMGLRSSEVIALRVDQIRTLDGHVVADVKTKGLENDLDRIKIATEAWSLFDAGWTPPRLPMGRSFVASLRVGCGSCRGVRCASMG